MEFQHEGEQQNVTINGSFKLAVANNPLLQALSPEVLASMIDEATKNNHTESIDMLLNQCFLTGSSAANLLDKVMHHKLSKISDPAEVLTAALLISQSIQQHQASQLKVSAALCQLVLTILVDHCRWSQAYATIMYMIPRGIPFARGTDTSPLPSSISSTTPDKAVFYTTGALLRDTAGLVKVLRLLTAMADHRRSDMEGLCSFTKAHKFFSFQPASTSTSFSSSSSSSSTTSSSSHTSSRDRHHLRTVPVKEMREAMDAQLSALRTHSWLSFSATKLLLTIAVGSRQLDLAQSFVREAVTAATDANRAATAPGRPHQAVDVLSLIRALSQGDGVAESLRGQRLFRQPGPQVTLTLLNLLVQHIGSSRGILWSGPLSYMDLCNAYWVLAFRCRFAHLQLHDSRHDAATVAAFREVDRSTLNIYEQVLGFFNDETKKREVFP